MLRRRRPGENVPALREEREVEARAAPLTVASLLHPVRLIQDDVRRFLHHPARDRRVPALEPLVVHEEYFASGYAPDKPLDPGRRFEALFRFGEPRVERTDRRYDEELLDASAFALRLVCCVRDRGLPRAGDTEVRPVWQGKHVCEVSLLE